MNSNIIPLTDDQRLTAAEQAAAIVVRAIGTKPTPEQFTGDAMSRYPGWVTRMIAGLMAVAFLGAAMPSLFRLFTAGRDYFLMGINDTSQAAIVGISTFVLSEFLVILSTVAANVLFTGRVRYLFIIPVVMGLLMALVGNVTVVQPHDLFSWLEAIIPVFAVLFIALVGERLMLHSIEQRHDGTRLYDAARREYDHATRDPENHPRYRNAYANALKKALMDVNSRGTGATARREMMAALTPSEWRQLVDRELSADDWFMLPPAAEVERETVTVPVIPFGHTVPAPDGPEYMLTNGNGTHSNNGHIGNGNGSPLPK